MKPNILKTVFTFFLAAILFVACEDEPTSLGLDNIPPRDTIGITSVTSIDLQMEQKSSFYNAGISDTAWNLGTSIRLFAGTTDKITSTMLIRFGSSVEDSIIEYYDNGELTIEKAWIELKPVSTLGDDGSSLTMNVSKINTDWNSFLFTKDSLEQYILPYISDTRTVNVTNDTLISFEIPTEMASEWFLGSIRDSTELNYGLLFEPVPGSNKIYGFYSLHQDNISLGYDNIPVTKIEVKKASGDLDTLNFYSLRDVHVVESQLPADDGSYIYLQGGIPLRGNYYIDVSPIPENSIIVDADLEFYYDSSSSIFASSGSSSINLIMYSDSTNKKPLLGTSIRTLVKDTVENKYIGNVTSFIQRWNQGTENQGVFVYIPDEQYTLNRVAVFGPKYSDPLLRPKLTIRYTKQ